MQLVNVFGVNPVINVHNIASQLNVTPGALEINGLINISILLPEFTDNENFPEIKSPQTSSRIK